MSTPSLSTSLHHFHVVLTRPFLWPFIATINVGNFTIRTESADRGQQPGARQRLFAKSTFGYTTVRTCTFQIVCVILSVFHLLQVRFSFSSLAGLWPRKIACVVETNWVIRHAMSIKRHAIGYSTMFNFVVVLTKTNENFDITKSRNFGLKLIFTCTLNFQCLR